MKAICKIMFIFYWILTFLYVSPDNFIKVKADASLEVFKIFCEQRWGFFAPPPQYNDRLYYTFLDDQRNELATYEALEPLLMEKQRKKPWNTREDAIDYIVNGSMTNIIDFIIAQKEVYKQLYPDSTSVVIEKKAKLAIIERYNEIPPFVTLVEYGKIVANKNFTEAEYSKIESFKIAITQQQLPKFIDRANLTNGTTLTEGLLFETPPISLENEAKSLTLDGSNNQ